MNHVTIYKKSLLIHSISCSRVSGQVIEREYRHINSYSKIKLQVTIIATLPTHSDKSLNKIESAYYNKYKNRST